MALRTDPLLLSGPAQRVAAGATEEHPFGEPGAALGPGSSLRRGFGYGLGALLALALALAVRAVASELLLVVVAAFIAIGLEPLVGWLVTRGMRRGFAVTLIVVVAIGGVVAFLSTAVPPIVTQAAQLVQNAPDYLQQLQDEHTTIGRLNAQFDLVGHARDLASESLSISSFGGLLGVGAVIVSYSFQLIVVVVLSIYFLADFPGIKRAAYRLAPLSRRPRVGLLGDAILSRTGGYVLGNVFTSVIAAVAQFIALRFLGVPFALALAVFVGVFDLVPLVGSTLAGVVVTVVALATVSVTAAVVNVVFTVVYRLFEDYVLSPRVLARTVEVPPPVTVIAVLLGGALLGIEGALIAVPVAAAVQLLLTEVVYARTDVAPPA